jgi:3-deoxy-D-manno-octulosonic-acid transferase
LYGPHMDDFQEERALLEEAGAGITCRNRENLFVALRELLADPERLRTKGEAGRRAVAANRGAADRYADLIENSLRIV